MNPFAREYALNETMAAQQKVDPRLIHGAKGVQASLLAAPAIAGAADLFVGDTNGLNSNEALTNLVHAIIGTTVGLEGAGVSELINREIDKQAKAAPAPKRASEVNVKDPKIRKEMMRIRNEEGADAAAAYIGKLKDAADAKMGEPMEGIYTKSGATKRRMAGKALSALLGAGISIPFMVDEQY